MNDVINRGSCPPGSSFCDATPAGGLWPVCSLEPGHDGEHESADYRWAEGDGVPRLKALFPNWRQP